MALPAPPTPLHAPPGRPAFDAILFDLDGTLADSSADIRTALGRAFAEIQVDMSERLHALVDGSPLEEIFAAAVPGGTVDEMNRFIAAYRQHYERCHADQTRLFPGVRETLDALAALRPRVKLAVATAKRDPSAQAVVQALGIQDHFDLVAGSGGTHLAPKPAPDLLLDIALRLGVSPGRALMVGDTLRDITAGKRAGMRTAAVTYGHGRADVIMNAQPDYVLEEFDELLVILGLEA